jgi:chromosome segregation ATPase
LNIEKCAVESDRDRHEAASQEQERSLNSENEQHTTTRNALSSANDRISALEEQIGQLRIEENSVESTAKGLEQQNDGLDAEVGWLKSSSSTCKTNVEEALRSLLHPAYKDTNEVPALAQLVMQEKRWALSTAEVRRGPWIVSTRSAFTRKDISYWQGGSVLLLA